MSFNPGIGRISPIFRPQDHVQQVRAYNQQQRAQQPPAATQPLQHNPVTPQPGRNPQFQGTRTPPPAPAPVAYPGPGMLDPFRMFGPVVQPLGGGVGLAGPDGTGFGTGMMTPGSLGQQVAQQQQGPTVAGQPAPGGQLQSVGGMGGPPQDTSMSGGKFGGGTAPTGMAFPGGNANFQLPQVPVAQGLLPESQAQTQNQIYPEPYNTSPFNTLATPSAMPQNRMI